MRSLRGLFRRVRAPNFGSDGRVEAPAVLGSDLLARLPIELHFLLLQYLGADDIVVALKASKILRMAWLSDDVWPWLADRWYPDLCQAIWVEATQQASTFRRVFGIDCPTGHHIKSEYLMGSKTDGPQSAAPEPSELFRQMLGKLCRRNGGRYMSALHHQMQLLEDPIFSHHPNVPLDQGGITSLNELDKDFLESAKTNSSRFMMYNNGRIAWWPDSYSTPYIAVVDDLRKATRKIYQFPDHGGVKRGYKTAMSDKLFVIAKHSSVHAWHFEKDVLGSVVVPEPCERCIAEGSKVLIISRSAELYIWHFRGPLQRVFSDGVRCYQPGPIRMGGLVEAPLQSHSPLFHIPRRQGLLLKGNGMLLDFILHPSLGDVLFVVTMHEGELIVHESDQGKLVKSYPFHTYTTTTVEKWKFNEYLRWERCDSYGGYCLFSVYLGVDNELSPSDLQNPEKPFCTCGQKTGLVSVCFNIYTKAFRVKCHHFLHSYGLLVAPVPAALHLWQDKIYMSYTTVEMRAGMPITALRCCLAVQERQDIASDNKIPVFTISESSRGFLTRRHKSFPDVISEFRDSWRSQVDFGLDLTARCASNSVRSRVKILWNWDTPNVHQTQTIIGDDDFLIYMVDGVYTAWSFGNEIPVPKEVIKWAPWIRT